MNHDDFEGKGGKRESAWFETWFARHQRCQLTSDSSTSTSGATAGREHAVPPVVDSCLTMADKVGRFVSGRCSLSLPGLAISADSTGGAHDAKLVDHHEHCPRGAGMAMERCSFSNSIQVL